MKAMLFAAGLGTRLRPLTNDRPKALVEVNGTPLLEIAIRRLIAAGCEELIINVHHFAGLIVDFLEKMKPEGIRIAVSDEQDLLLDTGGGLKKAAWFFDDGRPFLVCNTDILTNLDLENLYRQHLKTKALATLAVRRRKTSRYLLFDEKMNMKGWRNAKTGETIWCGENSGAGVEEWAFSGIQVLSPEIFKWMPEKDVFSIIEVYLQAAGGCTVRGFPHDDDFWLDVGKPESLAKAEHWNWETGRMEQV